MAIPPIASKPAGRSLVQRPAAATGDFAGEGAKSVLRARGAVAGAGNRIDAVRQPVARPGPAQAMTAARVKATASRIANPDKRRQFLNGSDALVAAIFSLSNIYSGPDSARSRLAKRGFPAQGLQPLTGAELTHWRRQDGTPFLPPGCEESPQNPGVFLHPSGLVFSLTKMKQRNVRDSSTNLLLTFGGTTGGLAPATSTAQRATDNYGPFIQQWVHNIGSHLGKETAINAAAKDLLGATQEQTRLQETQGQPSYGKVVVAGHSLGAAAGLHASAALAGPDGIGPMIAVDSPAVKYSAETMADLAKLGQRTGKTSEQVLKQAHIHIHGDDDPVVASAYLLPRGSNVEPPIARTFAIPRRGDLGGGSIFTRHNDFDEMILDARFNAAIPSAIGQSLEPRRQRPS
jgi:pimeloyl-ACP methyl ester carboxylesterase